MHSNVKSALAELIGAIAQLLIGAAAGAFLLLYLLCATGGLAATTGSLTASDPLRTIVLAAVLTSFPVIAVFGAGVAIGFVLAMDIRKGSALTGASTHRARAFGE